MGFGGFRGRWYRTRFENLPKGTTYGRARVTPDYTLLSRSIPLAQVHFFLDLFVFFFAAFLVVVFFATVLRPAAGFRALPAFTLVAGDFFAVFLAALVALFAGFFGACFEVDFFRRGVITTGGTAVSASKSPPPVIGIKATGCPAGFSGSGSIACCRASDAVVAIFSTASLILSTSCSITFLSLLPSTVWPPKIGFPRIFLLKNRAIA